MPLHTISHLSFQSPASANPLSSVRMIHGVRVTGVCYGNLKYNAGWGGRAADDVSI